MKKQFKNPFKKLLFTVGLLGLVFSNLLFSSELEAFSGLQNLKHLQSPQENCRSLLFSSREGMTLFRYAALYAEKILDAHDALSRFKPYGSIEEALEKMPVAAHRFYDINALKGDGIGHLHLFSVKNGNPPEKLFVKIPNVAQMNGADFHLGTRTFVDVLNEINWARFLSDIGLGPRFYGVYQTAEGRIALVYEYFEADHVSRFGNYKFSSHQAKERALSALREMREIFSFLSVQVHDLQFRVDDSGLVKIIDAEFFDLVNSVPTKQHGYQPNSDPYSRIQGSIDTRKVFDFYINALEKSN